MGRKKNKEPKNKNLHLKITEKEEKEIEELCENHNLSSKSYFMKIAINRFKKHLENKDKQK